MAQVLRNLDKTATYDGQGTGTNNDTSETFYPQTSFMVLVTGTVVANVTYTVEWLPDNLPENTSTWYAADGEETINSSDNLAKVNFAKGFMYRIKREGTGNQNSALAFYWGNATNADFRSG